MLTEVHRQAVDDPIIRLSMEVREGRSLTPGDYGDSQVVAKKSLDPERVMQSDQILVGRNATRRAYNRRMRGTKGFFRRAAGGGRQAGLPQEQPQEGPPERRAMERRESPCRVARRDHEDVPHAGRRRPRGQGFGADRNVLPGEIGGNRMGGSASPMTNSISAMCSPCTNRRARSGTTSCCSTRVFAFPDSRERWLYTGITRAARKLTVVV